MSKHNFKYIDHPSDVIIETSGTTLYEAISNAAVGMYNYMCDLTSLEIKINREFVIDREDDPRDLLYTFMDECLYLYGSEYFIAKEIDVEQVDNTLRVSLRGDIFDKKIHIAGREIKAITKHGITVEMEGESTRLMILVDI